ncbi:MAG: VWA domain-containing protein [Candidatus Scalinduaceae bacterium]
MNLADPIFLIVLIPFVFLIFLRKEKSFLGYSSVRHLKGTKSIKTLARRLPKIFCFLTILFAVLAFSKPQSDYHETEIAFQGREMILSIDTSFSMVGEAMETVKGVIKDFIRKRSNDLIGISIYGTDAALIVLPTWEVQLLEKTIERIRPHQVGYRTAVGEGIFTSTLALIEEDMGEEFEIRRLRKSINKVRGLGEYALNFAKRVDKKGTMKNKVVILFTDGIYNVGINPVRSLRLTKRLGVKVYVVATKPSAETGVEPEQAAERIADLKEGVKSTGGRYFEAENFKEIKQFYEEINKIEKDKIVVEKIVKKRDLLFFPTAISIGFLFGMIMLENVWLKIP